MHDNAQVNNEQRQRFDEFSPRQFILRIQGLFKYVLRKWYVVLVLALLGGTAAWLYYSSKNKTTFTAETTFAINEEATTDQRRGFSEITEQLGLGPSDGGSFFKNESNIMALMMSRLIIEQALSDSMIVNNRRFVFADFFIDSLGFRKEWVAGSPYPNTHFYKTPASDNEILFRNILHNKMYRELTTRMLASDKKIKSANFISVTCTSTSEYFSKYFLDRLLEKVSAYYVRSQTGRNVENMSVIKKRLDSVRAAYVANLGGRARMADANINLVRQIAAVPGEKKQTDVEILKSAYVDLSRNYESAKTSLVKSTPVIQVLDSPVFPLEPHTTNLFIKFLIFFAVGAFVAVLCLLLTGLYKVAMQQ